MKIRLIGLGFLSFLMCVLIGCNDEITYATSRTVKLKFQKDTIKFDRVFTTIGSSTVVTKVYNKTNEHQLIRSLKLADAAHSGFRVNVNGESGTSFQNIEIRKQDSIYVFIEVTVDPQHKKNPVLIKDSLVFELYNGVKQDMKLFAYGQDVIILRGKTIQENTTFTDDRPYLIYDSLRIDEGYTLTLNPGTELYFHDKIDCKVHGTLDANGTLDQPVVFAGDRQDKLFSYLPYANVPGQWGGVHFYKNSYNNRLNYVDIHGGIYGIRCDSSNVHQQKLTLENSVIHNVSKHVFELTASKVFVGNSQLTNSGEATVKLLGGTSSFLHCTIANFMAWGTKTGGAVVIHNVQNKVDYPLHAANFKNCIITGFSSDELSGGSSEKEDVDFNYLFSYSLINTIVDPSAPNYSKVIVFYPHVVWDNSKTSSYNRNKNFLHINQDQKFRYDFRLNENSPARDIALPKDAVPYPLDRLGRKRLEGDTPDAGCYEFSIDDEYVPPVD